MNIPQIRLAHPTDVPLLAAVERSAAHAFLSLPNTVLSERTVPAALLTEMATAKKLWVAVDNTDQPIGFIGCREMTNLLYIHEISVAHEHQKQGIGRRLMLTVLNEAARAGYTAVGLTTRRDAAWNMPFYQSLGFEEVTDATTFPALSTQRDQEIRQGANAAIRCAMVKRLCSEKQVLARDAKHIALE